MLHKKILALGMATAIVAVGLTGWHTTAAASTVTLLASDGGGVSSFNTSANWSNGASPSSGNDYVVSSGYILRTPGAYDSYSFAGDSLTLTGNSTMRYKSGENNTITVSNFIMDSGTVDHGSVGAWSLAGNITLNAGGGTFIAATDASTLGRVINITAQISGAGMLTNGGLNTSGCYVSLSNMNTYSGGTSVLSGANLHATADGALGAGDVAVSGLLTLTTGSTNDYIANTAILTVNTGGSVVLDYLGTDIIDSLIVGGVTYYAPGTYGGSGSGAETILSGFTGTGTLTIVPEPTTMALLGLGGLFVVRRKSRHL